MNKKLVLKVLIFVALILSACSSGNNPPPEPTATAAPTEIVWPDWATRSCNTGRANVLFHGEPVDCAEILGGAEPNNVPTPIVLEERPAPEATATTATVIATATQVASAEQMASTVCGYTPNFRQYDYPINMDTGDGVMNGGGITMAGDHVLAFVTEGGLNLDTEYDTGDIDTSHMTGYLFLGAPDGETAQCVVEELVKSLNLEDVVYVRVGGSEMRDNWTAVFPTWEYWKFTVKSRTNDIWVKNLVSDAEPQPYNNADVSIPSQWAIDGTGNPEDVYAIYAQLHNEAVHGKFAIHWYIWSNQTAMCLERPKTQGTVMYQLGPNGPVNETQLGLNVTNSSVKVVAERDDHPYLLLMYVGPEAYRPAGWNQYDGEDSLAPFVDANWLSDNPEVAPLLTGWNVYNGACH